VELWRLSGVAHARAFDGGYGLLFGGRWNSRGHAVTYCATSPSLCVLEKLVHVDDPALLPALVMVRYEVPGDLAVERIDVGDLPGDWRGDEDLTRGRGDAWHRRQQAPLLAVPSAVIPIAGSPDINFVVNNAHPGAARIRLVAEMPFELDLRLL
jgi:RES domain-containing protein